MGERLTVQFARGSRQREGGGFGGAHHERAAPRPRRTPHRMQITGLPNDTSWQVCSSLLPLVAGFPGLLSPFFSYGALVTVPSAGQDCVWKRFSDRRIRTASLRIAGLAPWYLT